MWIWLSRVRILSPTLAAALLKEGRLGDLPRWLPRRRPTAAPALAGRVGAAVVNVPPSPADRVPLQQLFGVASRLPDTCHGVPMPLGGQARLTAGQLLGFGFTLLRKEQVHVRV